MERVYIGLGSNLAEPRQQLRNALDALENIPSSRLADVSSLYVSDPLGPPDQPRYYNAVAVLDTSLAPLALLDALPVSYTHRRCRRYAVCRSRWSPYH